MSRLALSLLLAASLATLAACTPTGKQTAQSPEDGQIVAIVDGAPISRADLDDWIRKQLFDREVASKSAADQFDVRSGALEGMIAERLIEAEAAANNESAEEALDRAVAELGPVSDQEVNDFFQENRARLRPPNNTLDAVGAQIRSFLETQRRQQVVTTLRETANVEIKLEPPRVEVAAIGPALGPDNAPITIVEFSDYECPFCSRAEPVVKQVIARYPDQVRLVFRHMPLESMHPNARGAAIAAMCADEQGRFWEFHDRLFANQRALLPENLATYAQEVGLDIGRYETCLTASEIDAKVQVDIDAAEALGINGTPAFFVNGISLSGAKPLSDFVEVIERELSLAASKEESS